MDSSQDRNLPASEQKLRKARSDGQAVRSKDLGHLVVLGVGVLTLLAILPTLADHLKLAISQHLVFSASLLKHPTAVLARLQDMVLLGLAASAGFGAVMITSSIASTLAVGGWVLSLKPVMPDFSRVSPFAGFGRLFSKEHYTDMAKLLVISSILLAVGGTHLVKGLPEISRLVLQPSTMALRHLLEWLSSGMLLMLLVTAAMAALDVPLQLFMHKSRLKMSHEEVKQENKEANGNPHVKGRQRQRQREIAQRNSVSAVPKADFVVMNPTHYAVALKYDESSMAAPQVIAKGADLLAFKIREVAKHHAIPVLQSPVLARALYTHAELDREIPAPLFGAVAQILAYVYRVKNAMKGLGPMPDAQPDPLVPPELDPLNPVAHVKKAKVSP